MNINREDILKQFLISLNLDLNDENLKETPRRMVNVYANLCKYYTPEAQDELKKLLNKTFPTKYKGMIIQDPIKIFSLCSHHLLPVTYEILFGYIPTDKALGFSKSIKAIEIIGARPILQEDFTQEIIETFDSILKPKGIMVVVRGLHSCIYMRETKSDSVNITSAVRGVFKDSINTRNEFLTLAKFNCHG